MEKNAIVIEGKEYKLIKVLGRGGFGRVYQVLSVSDNKFYAIKEIPIKNETENIIKEFQNVAVILSKFNSNNIVKYYGTSKDNNNIYILMEYYDGDNLRNFINENIKEHTLIEEDILYNIIKQICIGIKEIHDKRIVHRDLKPLHIFMNDNMDIKLGNFGLSKLINFDKTNTKKINQEIIIIFHLNY